MRGFWLGVVLLVAVPFPTGGSAAAFQFRTPAPDVSAGAAEWQINSEPILVGGLTFYPTRGFRLFDGQVMAQTGIFEGVPVYSDTTIEPYSELYVPLGSGRMRVYERRRERELAGTTGSHTPTFAVDSPTMPVRRERGGGTAGAVGTGGAIIPGTTADATFPVDRARSRRAATQERAAAEAGGVWLEFSGARWYSHGLAVPFTPDRFEPVGEYHGFPVYRDVTGDAGNIWVSVVRDGPVAPYQKR